MTHRIRKNLSTQARISLLFVDLKSSMFLWAHSETVSQSEDNLLSSDWLTDLLLPELHKKVFHQRGIELNKPVLEAIFNLNSELREFPTE